MVADFDQDGFDDVATIGGSFTYQLPFIDFQDADGGFEVGPSTAPPSQVSDSSFPVIGDFNHDSFPDLMVPAPNGPYTLTYGDGTRTCLTISGVNAALAATFLTLEADPLSFDVDGDGDDDVLFTREVPSDGSTGAVQWAWQPVFLDGGIGALTYVSATSRSTGNGSVTVADGVFFPGRGVVASFDVDGGRLLQRYDALDGGWSLSASTNVPIGFQVQAAVDINGDGVLDLFGYYLGSDPQFENYDPVWEDGHCLGSN